MNKIIMVSSANRADVESFVMGKILNKGNINEFLKEDKYFINNGYSYEFDYKNDTFFVEVKIFDELTDVYKVIDNTLNYVFKSESNFFLTINYRNGLLASINKIHSKDDLMKKKGLL